LEFDRIDNPNAADRAVGHIGAGFDRLVRFPLSGRGREELAAGLRSYFVRPRYHIFYRVKGEQLEIVHVLHHARDLSRFFPDD
jgi:plasmid stabilization system protein ParE